MGGDLNDRVEYLIEPPRSYQGWKRRKTGGQLETKNSRFRKKHAQADHAHSKGTRGEKRSKAEEPHRRQTPRRCVRWRELFYRYPLWGSISTQKRGDSRSGKLPGLICSASTIARSPLVAKLPEGIERVEKCTVRTAYSKTAVGATGVSL